MQRLARTLTAALLLAALARPARADPLRVFELEPGGRVQAVRLADLDGDGRQDLVLLLAAEKGAGQSLLLLRTPARPVGSTYFDPAAAVRIDLGAEATAQAGAVAIGRFGPQGEVRLRFLGPDGLLDLRPDGKPDAVTERHRVPTLLARSAGRPIVFWDQVADLDGDGRDAIWFPLAGGGGPVHLLGPRAEQDRTLDLTVGNRGASDVEHAVVRHAWITALVAADLDGDGRSELVALQGQTLLAFAPHEPASGGRLAPALRLSLPFFKDRLEPEEIHTPRLHLADVDGDGRADLLVTIVTGRRDQLTSLRTIFLHFPGPFVGPEGRLVAPKVRLDTESVALHPRFVDLDGDGALDYVADAIRGGQIDLVRRVLGQDPTIWYEGFRFDRERGTFAREPLFAVERPYSREEAVSNRFGLAASFAGDFDGDGRGDLLDLAAMESVEVLGAARAARGTQKSWSFSRTLLARTRLSEPVVGEPLVVDLDGDGRAEAVLHGERRVFVVAAGDGS